MADPQETYTKIGEIENDWILKDSKGNIVRRHFTKNSYHDYKEKGGQK